jgi:hypothetical protein
MPKYETISNIIRHPASTNGANKKLPRRPRSSMVERVTSSIYAFVVSAHDEVAGSIPSEGIKSSKPSFFLLFCF